MTVLRQKMIEDMQLRGFAPRTQEAYLLAARATITIALCGIKFFFQHTLDREWKTFDFLRPPPEHKLPVVLSVEEVGRILKCVQRQPYRVCLSVIYACGLQGSVCK